MLTSLLMCLVLNDPAFELRKMISPPAFSLREVFEVQVQQRRARETGDLSRKQTRGFNYTQRPLKMTEDGEVVSFICHFNKAWRQKKDASVPFDFQGYHVLFEKRGGIWEHAAYKVEAGQRRDMPMNPKPLKELGAELDRFWRSYSVLKESLPNGPVYVGGSWPMDSRLLAGVTGNLRGFDKERSLLRMTLEKVTDEAITLKIHGELILSGEDYEKDIAMEWKGKVVEGRLVIRRGPYLELERHLLLNESVLMSDGKDEIKGTGSVMVSVKAEVKALSRDE